MPWYCEGMTTTDEHFSEWADAIESFFTVYREPPSEVVAEAVAFAVKPYGLERIATEYNLEPICLADFLQACVVYVTRSYVP